jgi:hypothetical protein
MIQWMYFPKSQKPVPVVEKILSCFKNHASEIDSAKFNHSSNKVLSIVCKELQKIGFKVETSKKSGDKILVPVLFGLNGNMEKCFAADAFHELEGFVLEVEAGRGVTNHQFPKDLFQACMMSNVNYLCVAIRNLYKNRKDFEEVCRFFNTLYASNRLNLPLSGILVIGY